MKKSVYLVFVAIFVFVASCKVQHSATFTKVPADIQSYFTYLPERKPSFSIHRGGGEIQNYPENCIESFAYFATKMPCLIECDISLSKDSVLFMMHDNSFNRTTNLIGKTNELNWDEIKKGKLKDNFGNQTNYAIPSLENVLKWGKNKVIFTLDVKRGTPYKMVVEMVEKLHAENYSIIITYDLNEVIEVYHLNPTLLISATIRNETEYNRIHEAGIPDKNLIAFVGTREPSKDFLAFLHAKGISTILGTLGNLDKKAKANGLELYKQWFDSGVDIISTDFPLEAYSVIK